MSAGTPDDNPLQSRLRRLQELYDDGLITSAEYEESRARVERGDGDRTVSRLNPRSFPNWLRITLIVASSLWVVTIPFMFWERARYTWLPYMGAVMIPLFAFGSIASSLEDRTLETACKRAETTVARGIAGGEFDWLGDCNSDGLGYRVIEVEGGYSIAGSVDWTSAAGDRKRTDFEVRVTEDRAEIVGSSVRTLRTAPSPQPTRAPATPTRETRNQNPQLGSVVQVGSLDLIVHELESYDSTLDNMFNSSTIRVMVTFRNARGNDFYAMTLNSWDIIDQNGVIHSHDLFCTSCPSDASSIELAPSGMFTGYIYFNVTLPNSFSQLRYSPLFSTNEAIVDLR